MEHAEDLIKKGIAVREAQNYLRVKYINMFLQPSFISIVLDNENVFQQEKLFSNKVNIIHSKYKIFYNGEIKTIKFMFILFTLHSAIHKF
jgi:hypothetical protein